jgi:hypothetical protein
MSRLFSILRNPHVLNYVILVPATLVPVLLYANMRAPSQEQVETVLVRVGG